jgi:L-asparaginase/Glu-tRNA(Gln) amidotransferase subunit D
MDLTVATEKPIVITGAQRNLDEANADGPRNILYAVKIAASPEARGRGVLVALAGRIIPAWDATKSHNEDTTCFDGDATGAASASGILEDVRSKQRLPTIHAALKAAGVAVTYRGPVTYVPGIRGTARFEPRATLELRCVVANEVTENTTYIASVEVENETTGAEFTVERTP